MNWGHKPGLLPSVKHGSEINDVCLKHRVRTDFWMQNSRLLPDFFQNSNLFFQTPCDQ